MLKIVCIISALVCFHASASFTCDADLNYGLVVNKHSIRVLDKDRTVYQINNAKQLIIKGNWVELSMQQQRKLTELAKGIHYAIPKVVFLAGEGADLAITTVEHMYLGLVGKRHKSYQRLQNSLAKVKEKVKKKFFKVGGNYYIGPEGLENVDDLVDPDLEFQLEQAFNTSVGGILSAVGGLPADGESGLDKRVKDLSFQLENMGAELERRIAPQANTLRKKAKWFCNEIKRLDEIEEALRATSPDLAPYDVIVTGIAKLK